MLYLLTIINAAPVFNSLLGLWFPILEERRQIVIFDDCSSFSLLFQGLLVLLLRMFLVILYNCSLGLLAFDIVLKHELLEGIVYLLLFPVKLNFLLSLSP